MKKKSILITLIITILMNSMMVIPINSIAAVEDEKFTVSEIPYNLSIIKAGHYTNEKNNQHAEDDDSKSIYLDSEGRLWEIDKDKKELKQILKTYKFSDIAVGKSHVIALDKDGYLWAWGSNAYGQLGNGTKSSSTEPVSIYPTKIFKSIACSNNASFAIDFDGKLYAWGSDKFGESQAHTSPTVTTMTEEYDGSYWGTATKRNTIKIQATPFNILADYRFSKVVASRDSVIAIDSEGYAWGWGSNDFGHVGNYSSNTTKHYNMTALTSADYDCLENAMKINTTKKFIDASIGASHSAFIDEAGKAYTMGSCTQGALGNGSSSGEMHNLTQPSYTEDIVLKDVIAGYHFTGFIDENNNVWMCGNNALGCIGNGTTTDTATIVKVKVDEITFVSFLNDTASRSIHVVDSNGNLWGWGLPKELLADNTAYGRVKTEPIQITGKLNQYTVTFKDGDTVLSTQKVTSGGSAVAPETPTKAGYTFAGWDKDFSNVTSDLMVNAKWTESDKTPYTVEQYRQNLTLDGYDFIGSDTYEGTTGQTVTAGITGIEGFFVDENNTNNQLTGVVAADGSLALKVYYDRSVYRVTLNTNGGAIPEGENVTSYTYGVGVTLPTPTKEGYIFAGWYITEDLTGDAIHTIGTEATGNKEYFAKWEEGTNTAYTVEHYKENLQGTYDKVEEDTQHLTGTTGQSVTVTPNTYEGFTIKEDNILTGTIAADGSLVIRVYYDRSVYQVTLETNGGTIAEGENVTRYTYGVGATLPTPTRDGYTFAGWYTNEELEGEAIAQITTTDIGDKEYFAKWEEGTGTAYKVEHYKQNIETNTYDKVETDDLTAKTGITVTARPKTYEGYHENTTHEERVASGVISADGSLVLKLYYDVNKYTVTFKNGDTVLSTQNIAHGASAVAPETPTRVGHTFTGWDKEFSNVTSNLEVNAIWTVSSYKVTLNTNGGIIAEGEEVISYTYGVGATLPTPTRDGYTFAGWYKTEDLTGDAITTIGTLATGDKIYYAKWNNNQYTVIFKDGDTVLSTQTVVYGQAAVAPEAPTKEGYTFAGWDKDFSKVTSNLTVNAKWNKNQEEEPKQIGYKVEHYKQNIKTNTYEKVATEELTGTRGSTVTAVAKTYEGFHENTSHKERVASGEVAEDGSLVLKLYYDINQYKVIFKDGDKVVKEETVTHGGNATPPTITKPGYILSWDKGTDNITGDTTFTAVWTKDPNYVDPNANKNDGKEEKPTFLPQTGESYIVVGMISIVMSVAILVYLKYRKLNNM